MQAPHTALHIAHAPTKQQQLKQQQKSYQRSSRAIVNVSKSRSETKSQPKHNRTSRKSNANWTNVMTENQAAAAAAAGKGARESAA